MNPRSLKRIGPYPVRRFVAEGGMAWLFEVEDTRFGARRALKMLKPEAASGQQFLRFEAEAKILGSIDHPSLVTIYDFGKDEETGCFYYTMTYIDGPSLRKHGPMSAAEAGSLAMDMLAGLARLHEEGIIHRDVKPGNIMLTPDGRAVLCDLGIARSEDRQQSGSLTRTGTVIGTYLYMSPEQARGLPVGPASDVFSAGLCLYELVIGESIYASVEGLDSTSGQEVLFYLGSLVHSGTDIRVPRTSELPSAIREVIEKACRCDANERYPDAGAMREALAAALENPNAWSLRGIARGRTPALAAIALAVVAAAGLWLALRAPGPARAADALASAAALERSTAELLASAASATPPPEVSHLADAEESLELARGLLSQARNEIRDERDAMAKTSLTMATENLQDACRRIGDPYLAGRANAAVQSLSQRVERLGAAGAATASPALWAELQRRIALIAQAPERRTPCETATGDRNRARMAPQIGELASRVEVDLPSEWPRLASAARDTAAIARDEVPESPHLNPDLVDLLGKADDAWEKASAALASEIFLEARESFDRSRHAWENAAPIAAAEQSRRNSERLSREADAIGIGELGSVERVLDGAHAAYERRRYAQAAREYDRAIVLLTRSLQNAETVRRVLARSATTDTTREAAVRLGSVHSAGEKMASADELREAAMLALDEEWYDDADMQFAKATAAYLAASAKAQSALDEARSAAAPARRLASALPENRCGQLSEAARAHCIEGWQAMRRAEAALSDANAPVAVVTFGRATRALGRARSVESEFQASRVAPPVLVARSPDASALRVRRGQRVALSVEASDPNGDPLRYAWSRNGISIANAASASLSFAASEAGTWSVLVEDGAGGRIRSEWTLELENQVPSLRLSPARREIELRVGEVQVLEARVDDPDGDRVDVQFFLDGRPWADGAVVEFAPTTPGTFVIEARADDGRGGRVSMERRFSVAEAARPVKPTSSYSAPPPP